jgi:flagellar biosynthetic protein FlhB
MAADERTEYPTVKKLKEAREKGQIARSRDLAVAAAPLAAVVALGRLGGRLVSGLGERLATDLAHVGSAPLKPVVAGDLTRLVAEAGLMLASLVGPIAMATMIVGVSVNGLQGGWSFAPAALTPDLTRLSPAKGIKRFAFAQAGLDTLKNLASVTVIAWLAYRAIVGMLTEVPRMPWMPAAQAAQLGWGHAEALLWRVAWGLAFLAVGDYALQRYRLIKSLKMTKQEIRDEAKGAEGSPEMKGRIRKVQREMARGRMIADVAKATVVITNPTHFAVALEYRRGGMSAPIVLAKGADHVAAAIRAKAREHGIPLVENKPLAQALFKTAEVGDAIPGPLFAAVAEVLAQLIRLKQLIL